MIIAVLRVHGGGVDPERFAAETGSPLDSHWPAGESRPNGNVPSMSAFTVLIGESESGAGCIRRIREWVARHRSSIERVREAGAGVLIDVGVTVGSPDQFTASITLTPNDLQLLAAAGIGWCVSAYPAAD
jgi:hypothetical protein